MEWRWDTRGFVTRVGSVTAQAPVERSFVVTRDEDTLVIEHIERAGDRVDSDFLDKSQGLRIAMTMVLAPGNLVTRSELIVRMATAAPDAQPLQHVTLDFESGVVAVTTGSGNSAPVTRVPVPEGTLPFLNLSVATAEQMLMRAKSLGGATAQVPIFSIAGGQITTATVRWSDAESAVLSLAGVDLHARVSPSGEIIYAEVPAQKVRFAMDGSAQTGSSLLSASPAPVPAPDYSAPAGAPYTAEEVRVTNAGAGIVLAGTLTMPRHAAGARMPAAVMITGSGPQDRDEATPAIPGWRPFREIADALGRRGIAVLRMDDRGVGGSERGPAGATSADFADDIRAALSYLRSRDDIETSRLALIGHSEGGMIAPIIAATDLALHAIVLIAGPSRTGRAVSDQQVRAAFVARGLAGAQLDAEIAANDRVREAQVAANPWLSFWFAHDPIPIAQRVTQPVLIIQGATDSQVSPDQAEELAAAFRSGGNRDVAVRVLPAINHLLVHDASGSFSDYAKLESLSVSPVVLAEIGSWLEEHFR
jgi:alpha-beta hydrolase superfamily lysophospholipase